jgi:hypothetical protein
MVTGPLARDQVSESGTESETGHVLVLAIKKAGFSLVCKKALVVVMARD